MDLYTKYEKEKRYVRRVNAQDLWLKLLVSQVETGVPYMLYKDACNEKSNQKNLGTIKSSNLCTEVVEYSSKDEVAVCNLASLSLPAFVGEDRCFDYADFHATVKLATKNLNRVIDRNMYPVEEAQRSTSATARSAWACKGSPTASSRCTLPTTRKRGLPSIGRSSK